MTRTVRLDTARRIEGVVDIEYFLRTRVIAQDKAIEKIVHAIGRQTSGMVRPGRTLANMLFLGPTGVGKTKVVEALSEAMFKRPDAMIKLNCGEYQQRQDTAKILGSVAGYIGFDENPDSLVISQNKLDKYRTKEWPLSILLLDEIEKANDGLLQLFLGILDKGTLNVSSGHTVDFSHTVVIMTSNLGAREFAKRDMGFGEQDQRSKERMTDMVLRKRFSMEFLNRIDDTIVFETLTREDLHQVLKAELREIQRRILISDKVPAFTFTLDHKAEIQILDRGTSTEFGARELNRALDDMVINHISNLLLSGQLETGDQLQIRGGGAQLGFYKAAQYIVAPGSYKQEAKQLREAEAW